MCYRSTIFIIAFDTMLRTIVSHAPTKDNGPFIFFFFKINFITLYFLPNPKSPH